ncbi:MAG: helix-turn-helix domain-containing protein [Cyanothece sp. SIO1E1]|nr:helix-turn-helix domain-containing protein [Cyanothece sp. SIO1E1]
MTNDIILQAISTKDLEEIIRTLVRTEFKAMNEELQRVIGEDDLVSTGTACRILGVCPKHLKKIIDTGHFTVYHHLKERRYNRGELLDHRNKYRVNKKRG